MRGGCLKTEVPCEGVRLMARKDLGRNGEEPCMDACELLVPKVQLCWAS